MHTVTITAHTSRLEQQPNPTAVFACACTQGQPSPLADVAGESWGPLAGDT